jgi:3',5'-cyclic AMP phosphodiesterase CpdA
MKIAHISDLHFGCASDSVREALLASLHELAPDLVIASGDITQSATVAEFREAEAFFKALPMPWLSIPGNHDLPGMDLARFIDPFARYKRHIAAELNPEFRSPLVHIKGLNSARMILAHWNWANGSISARQCKDLAQTFAASTAPWRICVLHHPLMNSKDFPLDVTVFNRTDLLATLAEQSIDIVLAGHQHHAYIETRQESEHKTLFVNASTAMSTRIRRQPNGFNLLTFSDTSVRIDMLRYGGRVFETFSALTHTKAVKAA